MTQSKLFRFKNSHNDNYEISDGKLYVTTQDRKIFLGKVSEKEIKAFKLVYGKEK